MAIRLEGIRFHHDSTSPRHSAIAIRKNFRQAVPSPEWQPGFIVHEQSLAAYAVEELAPTGPAIKARFQRIGPTPATAEIRAVPPQVGDLPQFLQDALNQLLLVAPLYYQAWRTYLNGLWDAINNLQGDVLGTVAPTKIEFDPSGDSGWVNLPLVGHRLRAVGVNVHRIGWQWQARAHALAPWLRLATTNHTIFTVLRTPTRPWLQTPARPDNTQLPWADALQVACTWAAGSLDVDAVATAITRAMYALGGSRFEYGCRVGAVTVYSEPVFDLSSFLQRVGGGLGRGPFVNCSDCATFTSTLANLLGADLWQSQMRDWQRGFHVNPIRAIGGRSFDPPCGIGQFSYHEVAWGGGATANDPIYDACLELDSDISAFGIVPLLPANLRFGQIGDGHYLDLLAAPITRQLCQARPELKRRRQVM